MSFPDIDPTSPLAPVANRLQALGLMAGFPDGTFRPDTPLTRGQYAYAVNQLVDHFGTIADLELELAYRDLAPATCTIYATTPEGQAIGSGVVVDARGYAVTCHHVVDGATELTVAWAAGPKRGQQTKAQVVLPAPEWDLALIRLETDQTDYPTVTLGVDTDAVIGRRVVAIGSPVGDVGRMSTGIIAAATKTIQYYRQPQSMLDTTAAINPGNSGGGLFTLDRRLLGITSMKLVDASLEAMGFAVPVSLVSGLIQRAQVQHLM